MTFKSFKPRNKENWEDETRSSPVPQKQNTYVAGFGFIPYDPKDEEKKYIKRRSNFLVISSIILVAIQLSLLRLRPFMFDAFNITTSTVNENIYNIVTLIIAILFSGVLYVTLIDMPFKKMFPTGGISLGVIFSGIGVYLFVSVIGEFITQITFFLLKYVDINLAKESSILPQTLWESIIHIILIYIIPVVIEEVYFGGILLQSLRPIGDGFAIITTTIMATLITASYSNIFTVFLTSLVLSFFAIKTENIIVPIFIRAFGSVLLGWKDLMVSAAPSSTSSIVNSIILIFLLLLGAVALWYIIYTKEDIIRLEDAESTINYKENINKFFTTPVFIAMTLLMIARIFWGSYGILRY